jgi:hypothetical protein
MKMRGAKRLRGAGCNSGKVKAVVSSWKKTYDQSGTYRLKSLPRQKNEHLLTSTEVTPPPATITRRFDRGKVQSRGTPRTDGSAESQA